MRLFSENNYLCMKRLASVLPIMCVSFYVFAQPVKDVPRHLHMEVANERMESGDYYNALVHFEEAYKQERSDDVAREIAQLHFKLRDYGRAERWLARVISNDETGQYPELVLMYARTLKMNGKYEEAVEAYNVYAGMVDDTDLLDVTDREVAGIQLAMDSEAPIELVIEHMGRKVNSRYSEFAPASHPDGDLYISALPSRDYVLETDAKFASVYTVPWSERRETWDDPEPLPEDINRPGYHTGNARFTDDGTRMFFTRSLMEGNDLVESKIYVSSGSSGSWKPPIEVENLNGEYIATHPTPGALLGNDVLIFASDMPGGEGGFDLYYSLLQGGEYSRPVNMGPTINTSGNEVTPYFRENTLYFSSDGHPGIGALDIFSSEWDGSAFGDPVNLGAGYNSGYDDWYFTADEGGTRGFIVSNREADGARSVKSKTCCDDIYTFEMRDVVLDLLTSVFDKQSKQPLPGARVTKFEVINNRPGKSESKENPDGNEFNFLLDFDKSYKVTVERDGYFPQEFSFNTVGIYEQQTFTSEIFLDKAPSAEPETRTITINEPIRLNNIYYDFDDDKILPDAEKDLEVLLDLMDEYPDMVIELSSHTDARGNDRYNERLSQRRAQSAVDWLVSHGIDPDRLDPVGYGERQILNRCVDGVKCTEAQHQFNRRTEFKIIAGPTSIEVRTDILDDEKKN